MSSRKRSPQSKERRDEYQEAIGQWQDSKKPIDGLREIHRQLEQTPDKAMEYLQALLATLWEQCNGWEMTLRDEFCFDVMTGAVMQTVSWENLTAMSSDADIQKFTGLRAAMKNLCAARTAIDALETVQEQAKFKKQPPAPAMFRALEKCVREDWATLDVLHDLSISREEGIVNAAAWIAGNTRQYPSLVKAIETQYPSWEAGLASELPVAVTPYALECLRAALEDVDPEPFHLTTARTKATGSIRKALTIRDTANLDDIAHTGAAPDPFAPDETDEWDTLTAAVEASKAKGNERQILALLLKDPALHSDNARLASIVGRPVPQVAVEKSNAFKKVRAATGK